MRNPLKNTEPIKDRWKRTMNDKIFGMEWRKGNEYVKLWKPAFYKGFRVSYGRDRMGTKIKESFATKKQALKYAQLLILK